MKRKKNCNKESNWHSITFLPKKIYLKILIANVQVLWLSLVISPIQLLDIFHHLSLCLNWMLGSEIIYLHCISKLRKNSNGFTLLFFRKDISYLFSVHVHAWERYHEQNNPSSHTNSTYGPNIPIFFKNNGINKLSPSKVRVSGLKGLFLPFLCNGKTLHMFHHDT